MELPEAETLPYYSQYPSFPAPNKHFTHSIELTCWELIGEVSWGSHLHFPTFVGMRIPWLPLNISDSRGLWGHCTASAALSRLWETLCEDVIVLFELIFLPLTNPLPVWRERWVPMYPIYWLGYFKHEFVGLPSTCLPAWQIGLCPDLSAIECDAHVCPRRVFLDKKRNCLG